MLSSSLCALGNLWKTPHSFSIPDHSQETSITLSRPNAVLHKKQLRENLLLIVLSERAQQAAVHLVT